MTALDLDRIVAEIVEYLLVETSLASYIDHTQLRPDATSADIVKLCEEAKLYGFATVCVNPYWVTLAAAQLAGSAVKVCSVVGFPLGASASAMKCAEAELAIRNGAREIDMVINVGALREGDLETVRLDIKAVADVCHRHGALLKVILENALLNREQKVAGCEAAQRAGADFVKTSTGFAASGATPEDVALMRSVVGPGMGVKAAGGVRTRADALLMIEAGANRLGASSSVAIMKGSGPTRSGY
ncbi:MAG: deoxyribose-phosphate aldolase [Bryobacteraceae bacterium]|nr:deoxyribose-phosphate aldolase [Bryobacteraceae bacterium]